MSSAMVLQEQHREHLATEGFTEEDIALLQEWGCKSITRRDSINMNLKVWNGTRSLTDGGLWFKFSETYGQNRLNKPIKIGNKTIKYLSPRGPVEAWKPANFEVITEGYKDAALPTLRGVSTAAIVGVDNIIHCIPEGCKKTIIFDSDGWRKPAVMRGLIKGALWTKGKINLFPEMPNYPNGGSCEFFKSGGTIGEYEKLIEEAMEPDEILEAWVKKIRDFDSELMDECMSTYFKLKKQISEVNSFFNGLQHKQIQVQEKWNG